VNGIDVDLAITLGGHRLRSPLIAASGTVGAVVDFAATAAFDAYGAAVAKSVSVEPWPGRPAPRMAPAGQGMLNGIGIQNPGIDAWVADVGSRIRSVGVEVWGSAVGHRPSEFAEVALRLESAGVAAVEVNLSCPNLDAPDGARRMSFALDPAAAASVVAAVTERVGCPVGAKLSPNAADIVAVAAAVAEAGADWVVLTNTVWGAGIDIEQRRPVLSGGVGGLSGPPLKPIALRGVLAVRRGLPGLPIVGGGGVRNGEDVVEYLMAGASAVAIGTAHFASPRVGGRVRRQLASWCRKHGVNRVADLTGAAVDGATW
jgi:dihydroorotate dehydrogenase (NAD+) catalytic subunit